MSPEPRVYVVTGAASGIGRATSQLLIERGERVIGVDRHDCEVTADLGTAAGRDDMVDRVTALCGGQVDAVLAVAGVSALAPVTVAVNFFGAVATLEGLRPLLGRSATPRAVAVSSAVSLFPTDDPLVHSMTARDEPSALHRAEELARTGSDGQLIYPSTKKALAQWVRRAAPGPDWAGQQIALNAIAPGVIRTPMVSAALETQAGRRNIEHGVPMPLNGFAEPEAVAHLLAWLAGPENTHLCGQVVFIDGGADALIRGDTTW